MWLDAQEVASAADAVDPATQSHGLFHEKNVFGDDPLLLNGGIADGAVEVAQRHRAAFRRIIVEMAAAAFSEPVESAGLVAIIGIHDEIAVFVAEQDEEQVEIDAGDFSDRNEVGACPAGWRTTD